MLYPNLCCNEVCYKETVLYSVNLNNSKPAHSTCLSLIKFGIQLNSDDGAYFQIPFLFSYHNTVGTNNIHHSRTTNKVWRDYKNLS